MDVFPYAVVGPLVLAEGPAATVLAGSMVGAGVALFWPILAIVVAADVAADSALFLLGRLGNRPRVARLLVRLGLTPARRQRLTEAVHHSLPRVVISAKLADLLAVPSYLATGLAGVSYRRFVAWVASASVIRSAALIGLGVLFGRQAVDLLWIAVALAAGLLILRLAQGLFRRRLA